MTPYHHDRQQQTGLRLLASLPTSAAMATALVHNLDYEQDSNGTSLFPSLQTDIGPSFFSTVHDMLPQLLFHNPDAQISIVQCATPRYPTGIVPMPSCTALPPARTPLP